LADLRQFSEAIAKYEEARAIFLELRDGAKAANCLANKGIALKNGRHLEWARRSLEDALEEFRLCNHKFGEGQVLGNLGNVCSALGDHELAVEMHRRSLQLSRELHDERGEAADLANLGAALIAAGLPWDEAVMLLSEAVRRFDRLGITRAAATTIYDLGVAFETSGNLVRAIECYSGAAERWAALGDRQGEARARRCLSEVLKKHGEADEAIAQLRRVTEGYGEFDSEAAAALRFRAAQWTDKLGR
jgi:tetratricopeptide (TPR) repeat protein